MIASNATEKLSAAELLQAWPAANLQQTIVKLNVGGVRFETSLTTLMRYPESMFAIWFANWKKENQEEYFIDFDGEVFKLVLYFLRYGESTILPKDEQSLQRLCHAADYFQLPRLQLHAANLASNKQGLRGVELSDEQLVKFSAFGVANCVDSFGLACMRLLDTSHAVARLSNVRILGLTTEIEYGQGKTPGCSVCCPACGMARWTTLSSVPKPSLQAVLQKYNDVFQSQMADAVVAVVTPTHMRDSDCAIVVYKKLNYESQYNFYHVAKCFLLSAA